jgi:hypothetical protein
VGLRLRGEHAGRRRLLLDWAETPPIGGYPSGWVKMPSIWEACFLLCADGFSDGIPKTPREIHGGLA